MTMERLWTAEDSEAIEPVFRAGLALSAMLFCQECFRVWDAPEHVLLKRCYQYHCRSCPVEALEGLNQFQRRFLADVHPYTRLYNVYGRPGVKEVVLLKEIELADQRVKRRRMEYASRAPVTGRIYFTSKARWPTWKGSLTLYDYDAGYQLLMNENAQYRVEVAGEQGAEKEAAVADARALFLMPADFSTLR